MPRQPNVSAENNFIGGLKTEFTGLNFPENACTDTDNCIFNRIGNVTRRLGIDFETNRTSAGIDFTGYAQSSFKWDNAGGDGNVKLLAKQVGPKVYFYRYSNATIANPISHQLLASTINLTDFKASGTTTVDPAKECEFAAGNGYLFIFHPNTEPVACIYEAGVITGQSVLIKTRDFEGLVEVGIADDFRPPGMSTQHDYNLRNQGWTATPAWTATSTTIMDTGLGVHTWIVQAGLPIAPGNLVTIVGTFLFGSEPIFNAYMSGTVNAYVGTSLQLNITSSSNVGSTANSWTFALVGTGKVTTFQTAVGLLPSNSDVWWNFKNASNVFDPANTAANVTLATAPAPKGAFILDAFNQDRTSISTVPGIAIVSTGGVRPSTGTWFQGRIWYSGVNAAGFSESIYFSQIVEVKGQFGKCYQVNDPTSEERFDLLPSDGGIIRIQGCGRIFKLFPIQNGMLVFAANGVWFITGSQGIGFTANDYTITKISSIQTIASTSFVDVQGLPVWWNEEGIYTVSPAQQGGGPSERIAGLSVTSLTLPTISSFYEEVPLTSKRYARGDYNPLTYTIQWTYRDSEETDVTSRYQFNRILNFNTSIQAFYPWTIATSETAPHVNGVVYIVAPGGSTSPDPTFKYITSYTSGIEQITFSEEIDTTYKDWETQIIGIDYTSSFITGYKLHGAAQRKFQPTYVYMYSNNEENTAYRIQGIWNYANSGNSGKFSAIQQVEIEVENFDKIFRRHKIRGHGVVLQLKVLSVTGQPFDIMGWSIFETINASI